jgi:aminopeptidase
VPADSRIEQYASLLVDRCLGVQPGWQVAVRGQPLGRPLIEEVVRQIARRGAYALLRLSFEPFGGGWLKEAPEELVGELPDIVRYELEHLDAFVNVVAPENTRASSDVPPNRLALLQRATRPYTIGFLDHSRPWVGCQWPTNAAAQDAGMTLAQWEEFVFGAVLIDWHALERQMERIKERFDGAREVRVVGEDTDLRFSLAGRHGHVSGVGPNMPSGEVFYSPNEESVEGVVRFGEFPAVYAGHDVRGARFRYEAGRIVEASADADEEFLLGMLDSDEGARRLGEFGIGCNPGIRRHVRNTLFDEKIEGTVHFAVGQGFPFLGGKNESAIHWDMVKDLRRGGRIEVDGETVQEDGRWNL